MALDDFMDISSDDNESTSEDESKTTETEEKTQNISPKGPNGYETIEDYKNTIDGEINTDYDMIKYSMPIFPVITETEEYDTGTRYKDSEKKTPTACVLSQHTQVSDISRELLMLDTGKTSKDECMSVLSDRFNANVEDTTEVVLNIFLKTRHVVKLAMSNTVNESVNTQNRSVIMKAVYNEMYAQHLQSMLDDELTQEQEKTIMEIQEW